LGDDEWIKTAGGHSMGEFLGWSRSKEKHFFSVRVTRGPTKNADVLCRKNKSSLLWFFKLFSLQALKFLLILEMFLVIVPLRAEQFRFFYVKGNKFRILSVVQEDVYVDRRLTHQAEILNRIAVTITEVTADGTGRHDATFQTSERTTGVAGWGSFSWSREYRSVFDRDPLGRYTIGKEYYMPVVRDVPLFPDRDLAPGDTWSAPGEEVHDFRDSFGIVEPYRIPFVAHYTYVGTQPYQGKDYPTFTVRYTIFYEGPPVRGTLYPLRIMGSSDQTVYWSKEQGQPAAYRETFRIVIELSNGQTVEYRGTARADLYEAEPMNREQVAQDIQKALSGEKIENTSVRVSEEGVVISLENIQFEAESAVLLPSEQQKLRRIAQILQKYPDRDLLIAGHTALAGTAQGRQRLSEERARAVANFLLTLGVRRPEQVITRGYGAERPIADNSTEAGRSKNRRVEIILLEN